MKEKKLTHSLKQYIHIKIAITNKYFSWRIINLNCIKKRENELSNNQENDECSFEWQQYYSILIIHNTALLNNFRDTTTIRFDSLKIMVLTK